MAGSGFGILGDPPPPHDEDNCEVIDLLDAFIYAL